MLKLLPLSLTELDAANLLKGISTDEILIKGCMPKLYLSHNIKPIDYYSEWFSEFVERDLKHILEITDFNKFFKFIVLLANKVGQTIDLSQLAKEAYISTVKVLEWIEVLEDSYLIFRLNSDILNFNKDEKQLSKIYFNETGLVSYLLGIENRGRIKKKSF